MSAVAALARSDLRARWRGWLVATLLVGVAGGVVLATAAGARRTDTAYARLLGSSRSADAEIAPNAAGGHQNLGGLSSYYAAVARLPGVDQVAPTVGVSAVDTDNGNAAITLAGGTDARLGRELERPKITQGRMFDPARSEEGVADRALARQLHLHVGSVMHLLAGPFSPGGFDFAQAIPLTLRVVGLGVTRDNVIPVTATASQGGSLLVTPALLRGLNPDFYAYDAAFVGLKPLISVAAFGRAAQALLPMFPETGGQLSIVDEHQSAGKVEQGIHPQAVALALFALLVGLTSLLIIGQVVVRQVLVASNDNPTLRALGLTRAEIGLVGLAELGGTVAVGAALAVVVASALSPLTPIGPARVAEPYPGLSYNSAVLGLGAVAIVVLLALRVAPPVWRLASQPTRLDATVSPGGVDGPSRISRFLAQSGAPVSAVVGARLALEPGRGLTAIPLRSVLAGTAIAVAAVAAAFTFGTNMVRLVNTPRLYGQAWQVSVDAAYGSIPKGDVETFLRHQPGVSGWTFGNHGYATIAGHHVATIGVTGAKDPAMFPTLLEGRTPQSPDEVVLGSKTLADSHRRVGQMVTVALQGENRPRTMRVVGRAVFPFFGQGQDTPTGLGEGAAMLDPGLNPDGFNFVLVAMTPGRTEHDNVARFARDLKPTGACLQDQQECGVVTAQRPADVSNYARIKATPLALAGVLALLAVATVAHLLVTSIRRRRRDLAVLKTLGFVRRQVSAAVAWQATIVAAVALLVGLPVGLAAGRLAWQFFAARLGVAPEVQVPLVAVLVAIPAALAIANAVAAPPGWVAGRLQPAPVLRTE